MARASVQHGHKVVGRDRECPLWVIRDLAGQGRRSYLSAVTPKADKCGRDWIVRFVPEADIELLNQRPPTLDFGPATNDRGLHMVPIG
jgi:hypothetical protein